MVTPSSRAFVIHSQTRNRNLIIDIVGQYSTRTSASKMEDEEGKEDRTASTDSLFPASCDYCDEPCQWCYLRQHGRLKKTRPRAPYCDVCVETVMAQNGGFYFDRLAATKHACDKYILKFRLRSCSCFICDICIFCGHHRTDCCSNKESSSDEGCGYVCEHQNFF